MKNGRLEMRATEMKEPKNEEQMKSERRPQSSEEKFRDRRCEDMIAKDQEGIEIAERREETVRVNMRWRKGAQKKEGKRRPK